MRKENVLVYCTKERLRGLAGEEIGLEKPFALKTRGLLLRSAPKVLSSLSKSLPLGVQVLLLYDLGCNPLGIEYF